ncbi:MAG: hypothetical protein ACLQVY_15695 [Limisphaerales bacterium]
MVDINGLSGLVLGLARRFTWRKKWFNKSGPLRWNASPYSKGFARIDRVALIENHLIYPVSANHPGGAPAPSSPTPLAATCG